MHLILWTLLRCMYHIRAACFCVCVCVRACDHVVCVCVCVHECVCVHTIYAGVGDCIYLSVYVPMYLLSHLFFYNRSSASRSYSSSLSGLGIYEHFQPDMDEIHLQCDIQFTPNVFQRFYRLKRGEEVFNSKEYRRCKKSNNYTISYRQAHLNEVYGEIQYYIELRDTNSNSIAVIAKITSFSCNSLLVGSVHMPHLHHVIGTSTSYIFVKDILCKVIVIPRGTDIIVARPYNLVMQTCL